MARYVDGFVLAVPRRKLEAYRRISHGAGKVWKSYGALEYVDCVGDDLKTEMGRSFPRIVKPKAGEAVVFHGLFTSRARIATVSTPR